jgi:hypothetical protein
MKWSEIKKWAASYGYSTLKEKGTENYLWTKDDDPTVTGIANGVRDLSTQIYNHITDNKWVEYQEEYKRNKEIIFNE